MRIVTRRTVHDAIRLAESEAVIERIRAAIDLKHIEGHRFTVGGLVPAVSVPSATNRLNSGRQRSSV